MTEPPDAQCLQCGRPFRFARSQGRVYRSQKFCSARCRVAHHERRAALAPRQTPPLAPTPAAPMPTESQLHTMTLDHVLQFLATHRFSASTEQWIRERWETGQLPEQPKPKPKEESVIDHPLSDAEHREALAAVALVLARRAEADHAGEGTPGVLRRRVPQGGADP